MIELLDMRCLFKSLRSIICLRCEKMAGVGRGALRPGQGGKHYFVVVGLVIILIGVAANYWSLLVKHKRLISEFEKLRGIYQVITNECYVTFRKLLIAVNAL